MLVSNVLDLEESLNSDSQMKSKVIYDWLSFTSKIHTPQQIIDLLGFDNTAWENTKGAHGYQDRLYYQSISIHYNGRADMGIWIEMSGQGCRAFESYGNGDYNSIFNLIHANTDSKKMNLTRLDIAYDDHDGILDILTVADDTLKQNYISKSTEWDVNYSSKGTCIYIGSPTSLVRIRIYDKARERGYTNGTIWNRVELQLRDERAKLYTMLYGGVGQNFCSVLHNYLRYVIPNENESNKSRLVTTEYWQKLLDNANKISIYQKPGTDYNIYQCENYVYRQAGNAINALIDTYGISEFVDRLYSRDTKPNKKYNEMVSNEKLKSENKEKRESAFILINKETGEAVKNIYNAKNIF